MNGVCICIEISHSVLYVYNHSMPIKIKVETKMWLKILPYLSLKKLTKCQSRQNIIIAIYHQYKIDNIICIIILETHMDCIYITHLLSDRPHFKVTDGHF